nr:unnamed protein product [Callosobruchus chinensis]
MPMSVWFGVKFTPGGHSTFFGFLNTFVHIIMYGYYFLAALGPQYQKYLWWKKYLTALQMVQFILVMVHAFQLLFIDCDYPKAFVWWIGMHAVMFYFLFSNFYKQTYHKKDKKGKVKVEVRIAFVALFYQKLATQFREQMLILKCNVIYLNLNMTLKKQICTLFVHWEDLAIGPQ